MHRPLMTLPAMAPLALVAVLACDDGAPAPTAAPAPPPAAKLDLAQLQKMAENIALVPSPAEMQRALDHAGIAQGLGALVTDRAMKMDVEDKDVIAVRTGVLLADAILGVKDAPKDKLIARLAAVKTGMVALGAGTDLAATLDDLSARIANDGISRDDLVKELDEMHGAVIPEIKYEAGERCVPLLQAGGWLEGSDLVATAIITANKPEAGTQLLRQPQVVDYFAKYVEVEGPGKAPVEVLKQLSATLAKLKGIASKPALEMADVEEVKSQTAAVLAML